MKAIPQDVVLKFTDQDGNAVTDVTVTAQQFAALKACAKAQKQSLQQYCESVIVELLARKGGAR